MRALLHLAPLLALVVLALAGAYAPACQTYTAPPGVTLEGLSNGELSNPVAPLVIDFGMAIVPSTAKVEVAYFTLDANGDLPDETTPPGQLQTVLTHDPVTGDTGGTASFNAGDTSLTLTPANPLPVGPRLVLLVEPGLRSASNGRTLNYRTRVPFAYAVQCTAGAPATTFQDGTYFLLLSVEQPLGTTLKMFGVFTVNPATGALAGEITGAFRNMDGSRCPGGCPSTDACELLPSPMCVAPSTPPVSDDEYPDFVFNATPPVGYTLAVNGCAVQAGSGAAVNVVTLPATLSVDQPEVTIEGLTMSGQFAPDSSGTPRLSGSLTATQTKLATLSLGAATGTATAVRVPDDQVLPGLPQPVIYDDAGASP